MQKILFAAVTVSTLLSASAGFAQLGGGFQPPVYGSHAFVPDREPKPSVVH
jgi:hypothetical protein